jgi:hypothetical protein
MRNENVNEPTQKSVILAKNAVSGSTAVLKNYLTKNNCRKTIPLHWRIIMIKALCILFVKKSKMKCRNFTSAKTMNEDEFKKRK